MWILSTINIELSQFTSFSSSPSIFSMNLVVSQNQQMLDLLMMDKQQNKPRAFLSAWGVRGFKNAVKAELNCSKICAATLLITNKQKCDSIVELLGFFIL